jgi:hypothetical protein
MSKPKGKAVSSYRRRMKRRGFVRLELQVPRDDVPLVRQMAKALVDPRQAEDARSVLRERFGGLPALGLKALLAAAPLDDLDLNRARDVGRDVDL